MLRYLIVVALVATAATPASSQVVLQGDAGPLEIVGLRRWTVQDLEDSIARYAPGESLRSHACAVILHDRLHFPSAAVRVFQAPDRPSYVVVAVVEPQDSARAVRRVIDGAAGPDLWPALRTVTSDTSARNADVVAETAQFLGLLKRIGPDSGAAFLTRYFGETAALNTIALAKALDGLRGDAERDLAIRTLRTDANVSNRVLAAIVLSNFPDADAAWHALIAGMRDPQNQVGSAARVALSIMLPARTAKVDWTPSVADLVPLLAGANLWSYAEFLDVLGKTGVAPELATPLLRDNWHLVLSFARAQHPPSSSPARALLAAMSGTADPAQWEPWLKSLDAGSR